MTLRELQSEICALGFDRCAELDTSLIYAARRALAEISRDARIIRRIHVFTSFPRPSYTVKVFHHTGGRTELLPLKGCAYSLCASGKGRITIFDGKVKRSIAFDSKEKNLKGLLYGEGSLELSGEFSYKIFDLNTYSEPYFSNSEDIPEGICAYSLDMNEKVTDFLEFTGEITDSEGDLIDGVRLEGSRVLFPIGFSGELILSYYRNLRYPSLSEPDEPIDIPRELETQLSLLSASYLLLDRDPEKAEYYKEEYKRACSKRRHCGCDSLGNYIDTSGWA